MMQHHWIVRRLVIASRSYSFNLAVLTFLMLFLVIVGTVKAESDKALRQRFVIDFAQDMPMCLSMIRKDTDEKGKPIYLISPPSGAIEALFDIDRLPFRPYEGVHHYERGRLDFDNDGITDLVYRLRSTTHAFDADMYFVFANTPKPGADLPEEEQPDYEPWPENFGPEWLEKESQYIYPDMWGDCHHKSGKACDTYTIQHSRPNENAISYRFSYLHSEPFQLRGVTYLLAESYSADSRHVRVLFKPKPHKSVEEICVFRRIGRP